jgi:hypothetical protein
MRAIVVFARGLIFSDLTPHPHFTWAFATTLQTLHRLRTDQPQLTSLGCHFVAYNFQLASRFFFGLPTFQHNKHNQHQNHSALQHNDTSNSSSTSSTTQQATGGST